MFNWLKNKIKTSSTDLPLGQAGEQLAQEEYKRRGFEILAKNFYNRHGRQMGEIDFIAKNKKDLVFVEVKTRTLGSGKFGSGAEAVNFFKQQKLLKAAKYFLVHYKEFGNLAPRIDVCVIEQDGVDKNKKSVNIIMNAVEDD